MNSTQSMSDRIKEYEYVFCIYTQITEEITIVNPNIPINIMGPLDYFYWHFIIKYYTKNFKYIITNALNNLYSYINDNGFIDKNEITKLDLDYYKDSDDDSSDDGDDDSSDPDVKYFTDFYDRVHKFRFDVKLPRTKEKRAGLRYYEIAFKTILEKHGQKLFENNVLKPEILMNSKNKPTFLMKIISDMLNLSDNEIITNIRLSKHEIINYEELNESILKIYNPESQVLNHMGNDCSNVYNKFTHDEIEYKAKLKRDSEFRERERKRQEIAQIEKEIKRKQEYFEIFKHRNGNVCHKPCRYGDRCAHKNHQYFPRGLWGFNQWWEMYKHKEEPANFIKCPFKHT